MAAGPDSRLGSTEPGDKTGLRPSPALALAHPTSRARRRTLYVSLSPVSRDCLSDDREAEAGESPSGLPHCK